MTSSVRLRRMAKVSRSGHNSITVGMLRPVESKVWRAAGLYRPPVAAAIWRKELGRCCCTPAFRLPAGRSPLREGQRIGHRAHTEESLILADGQAAAMVAFGDFTHLERLLESIGSNRKDIGDGGGRGHVLGEVIISTWQTGERGRNRQVVSVWGACGAAGRGRCWPRACRIPAT